VISSTPCSVCGGSVRVTKHRTPTLANPNEYFEDRTCLNRSCATNETPPTLATPTP
jgi:hypothetical protein